MARQHSSERLDRTAFRSGKADDMSREEAILRKQLSPSARLNAAWVRTCRVYGIDPYNPPPMDRTRAAFRMGKLDDR